jgi:predicted negative regulator of RcsB-dependent stress response
MQLPDSSIDDIERMIRHLEKTIEANTVTPELLASLQKRLDTIDEKYRYDTAKDHEYHKLLELQGLIYRQQNKDSEAREFIDEAVRRSGGVSHLYSSSLRHFLAGKKSDPEPQPESDSTRPISIEQNSDGANIRYFDISLLKLILLSVFTFGIYHLYWFYRNWKAIKVATNQKISPFWRTVFAGLFAWPLFKQILGSAKQHGYDKSYSPGFLGILYFLSVATTNGLSRLPEYHLGVSVAVIIILLVSIIPLIYAQKAISYNNAQLTKDPPQTTTAGEVIFIIIGLIIGILAMIGWFVPDSSKDYSPEASAKKQEYDRLTARYNQCSSELLAEKDIVDTSDQASVDAYNAKYDVCESTRLQQNTAADEYNNAFNGQ